jgi:Eukaryotic aspartyl protease
MLTFWRSVDSQASSTFTSVAPGGFNISYADQSGSSGDYFTDNLQIGGATIKDLQMGLALKTTTSVGIMGIAYPVGESVANKNRYPNIIDQMVSQKLINLRAYSLWLDDKETTTGNVLFGGIDTEKFIGTLKAIPVQPDTRTKTIRSFTVYMTGLSVTDDSGTSTTLTASGYTLPVILDSGTTISYVPAKLLAAIVQSIGAVDDTAVSGFIFVDCDWRTTRPNSHLSFSFGDNGGPIINVPLSELIRSFNRQNVRIKGSPFQNTCNLGILSPGSGSTYLFGDTFLRSAYVVYDIDHNQIALAQTNFEATGSNIQDIPSSATGIPLLSGKSSGQTIVPQSYFTGKTPATGTGTATSRKSSTASTSVAAGSEVSANAGSATGTTAGSNPTGAQTTQTSKAAAMGQVPAFEKGGLIVFGISAMFALTGGSWFLAY